MQRDYFVTSRAFETIDDFRDVLRIWCRDGRAIADDDNTLHRTHLLNCLWSFSGTVHNELRALSAELHTLHAQLHYLARHQQVPLPMLPP